MVLGWYYSFVGTESSIVPRPLAQLIVLIGQIVAEPNLILMAPLYARLTTWIT